MAGPRGNKNDGTLLAFMRTHPALATLSVTTLAIMLAAVSVSAEVASGKRSDETDEVKLPKGAVRVTGSGQATFRSCTVFGQKVGFDSPVFCDANGCRKAGNGRTPEHTRGQEGVGRQHFRYGG